MYFLYTSLGAPAHAAKFLSYVRRNNKAVASSDFLKRGNLSPPASPASIARSSSPSASNPFLRRRLHQGVGAISAIVRGQRQEAIAGQQQLGSRRHLHDPPRRMGCGLRIRAEQPIAAAVDAVAGGPQSAKKFRPAEAGSRRQILFLGNRPSALRLDSALVEGFAHHHHRAAFRLHQRRAIAKGKKFHAALACHRQHHRGARGLPHLLGGMAAQGLKAFLGIGQRSAQRLARALAALQMRQ